MTELRLGIDLDGVVADFNTGWIERYNRHFGGELSRDAVQVWDGLHELTHFEGMEDFWAWAQEGETGSLFRHLEPYAGAVDALWKLHGDGHHIVIITSKPDWAIFDTFAWLADHRVPTREVHITEEKWKVGCDVYLDDAPHQLREVRRRRPQALVCRFVRPWNEAVPGTTDVEGWDHFVETVSRIAEAPRGG